MSEKLKTISCEVLMNTDISPTEFIVSKILPQGLHILGGSPKIGKSWFVLYLCLQIAKGEKLWEYDTLQGSVLYLALEDGLSRIQERVDLITETSTPHLHFAIMANSIADGLAQQIEEFILEHPDTRLIAIDTLQRVRDGVSDVNAYANDYKDIGAIKAIADKHKIAILLVHHLRKASDVDPVNMISGTTGLTGAVDGVYVLKKEKRVGNKATFVVTGRDVEEKELSIQFDKSLHTWIFLSDNSGEEENQTDFCIKKVMEYIKSEEIFIGSSSELVNLLHEKFNIKFNPMVLSRKLKQDKNLLLQKGIIYEYNRTGQKREITLMLSDANDDNDTKNSSGQSTNDVSQA